MGTAADHIRPRLLPRRMAQKQMGPYTVQGHYMIFDPDVKLFLFLYGSLLHLLIQAGSADDPRAVSQTCQENPCILL